MLGSYQKITRVLPGMPFGDGKDGPYSSATIPTIYTKSASTSSSGQKNLGVVANSFSNGDLILIHQTGGTGVGQWEINRIVSGGGSSPLVMQENLQYTYTDSGASQAQIIRIPRYTNVTVESGTWSLTGWDGSIGGIFPIACKNIFTVTGTVSGATFGFTGGAISGSNTYGQQGESYDGSEAYSQSANGGGGGGGGRETNVYDHDAGGGGGGGYATGGTAGGGATQDKGAAGGTYGNADLVSTFHLGSGGGGGGSAYEGSYGGPGGDGGGGIIIFTNSISISGNISANGANGTNSTHGGGGGGSGGSVMIQCRTANIGTSKITVGAGSGGTGGAYGYDGGAGGVGRIALHYSDSYAGTTSPTLNATNDNTLQETSGAFGIFI